MVLLAAAGAAAPPPAPRAMKVLGGGSGGGGRGAPRLAEGVRQPLFWWCYSVMAVMAANGLAVVSNLSAIAESYGLEVSGPLGTLIEVPLLSQPQPVLLISMQVCFVCFGLLRPAWGAAADRFGTVPTMVASFGLHSVLVLMWRAGLAGVSAAWWLAWGTGPAFAGYGVVFALMPSLGAVHVLSIIICPSLCPPACSIHVLMSCPAPR